MLSRIRADFYCCNPGLRPHISTIVGFCGFCGFVTSPRAASMPLGVTLPVQLRCPMASLSPCSFDAPWRHTLCAASMHLGSYLREALMSFDIKPSVQLRCLWRHSPLCSFDAPWRHSPLCSFDAPRRHTLGTASMYLGFYSSGVLMYFDIKPPVQLRCLWYYSPMCSFDAPWRHVPLLFWMSLGAVRLKWDHWAWSLLRIVSCIHGLSSVGPLYLRHWSQRVDANRLRGVSLKD